jgi:hypothetical protein
MVEMLTLGSLKNPPDLLIHKETIAANFRPAAAFPTHPEFQIKNT